MIKTLQKKFIFTAMVAISVLLVVLLGAINTFNAWTNARQSEALLNMIAQEEANPMMSMMPGMPDRNDLFGVSEDARRSAAYFTVYTDNSGNIIAADVSNIRSLTQEEAEKIAEKIADGKTKGRVGNYKYTTVQNVNGYTRAYIFLDTYSQNYYALVVLVLSALAGIVCWFFMLLLVVALSKKAIKPIAENMEKQKRFITDAGHEIKTPLAIIMANTEAMELHVGESKWSNNIKAQTLRLDTLTKNMLALAKIDDGKLSIPEEDVDVSLCVYKNTEMFKESARLKNITISQQISEGVSVRANTEYISRIVSILLDNAVKYTDENGNIDIFLMGTGTSFELAIANTYNGDDTDTEKLFDRFYRRDTARTQESGGYGIGLSAARAIAELYNGSVNAEVKDGTIVFKVKM